MALDIAYYKVTEDVAIRSGMIEKRYRTKDMNWILDNKDLGRVRLRTEEYISGLTGVEMIDLQTAETLIAENGYKMGYDGLLDNTGGGDTETETPVEQVVDAPIENVETETVGNENTGTENTEEESTGGDEQPSDENEEQQE